MESFITTLKFNYSYTVPLACNANDFFVFLITESIPIR